MSAQQAIRSVGRTIIPARKLCFTPFVLACVIALLPLSETRTMTPGPIVIRQCPACPQLLMEYTIGSGNSFGAERWTDGKLEAPMLRDRPPIVKCGKCKGLLWLNDAKEVARVESWERDEDKTTKAIQAEPATEADLLKFLRAAKLAREQTITVRTRAWWAANDAVRNSRGTLQFKHSREQVENLKLLASLFDEKDPAERLKKAEIARELGKFGECERLLSYPFDEPYATCASFIRTLAREKNATVRPFPAPPARRK